MHIQKHDVTDRNKLAFSLAAALLFSSALVACSKPIPDTDLAESNVLPTAQEIHAQAIVLDAHADIALPETNALYLGADGTSKVAPKKLQAGGFDAVVMSIAAGPQPRTDAGRAAAFAEAQAKLDAINKTVQENSALFAFANTSEEVREISESKRIAVILGFQNAQSLEGELDRLDMFYASGVRVFGLTHLGHNDFADSSRPKFDGATRKYEAQEEHGGLSALGREAIARIDALGGIVDVSQMSKAATLQAIELTQTPVIASHSGVRVLSDTTRNLSDEEIDRIGERGGVIHIAVFSAYLVDLSDPDLLQKIRDVRLVAGLPATYSYPYELYWELDDPAEKLQFLQNMRALVGQEDVARLVDHIDYVVDRIGIDHVGVGTDFNHGGGVVGFLEAQDAGSVTQELVDRGYSKEDIGKIWSGNFLRVLYQAAQIASKRD